MKLIERTEYLTKLRNVMGTPDVKVITGIRRCGKSKLLEMFMGELEGANIIHINFNLLENKPLQNYEALYEHINKQYQKNIKNYVFIDEVQMCQGFEKAINSLHATEKFDIYITGSNAFLLSSDLATLFTGRTFEIKVHPFSFSEFVQYYNLKDQYEAFDRFIIAGGMSGSYLYNTQEDKYDYIADVFNTLIVRDIKNKYKIRNEALMHKISEYLMDNISNLSSTRSIAETLSNNKQKINHKTVAAYLQYLCNAFAFYKIRRYDIKGKKYLLSNDKYYLCDHSFRYAKLGTKSMDYGRVIENIVAMELLRRGYEVYAGTLYSKEIDFVAIKRSEKIYIQVSENITDDKTFEREVAPLLKIQDAYPKLLLARTRHDMTDYEGIKIIDVANWLLS